MPQPVILRPAEKDHLSFYDVASAHVLMAFKAKGVPQSDLRIVVQQLQKEYPEALYPLLGRDFATFGKDVILRGIMRLFNLSRNRQMGLKNSEETSVSLGLGLIPT